MNKNNHSLVSFLFKDGKVKSNKRILRVLQSCAKKGVTIDPKTYSEGISHLQTIDFSYEEIKKLEQYSKHGAEVCEKKHRPPEAKDIYERLSLYFFERGVEENDTVV